MKRHPVHEKALHFHVSEHTAERMLRRFIELFHAQIPQLLLQNRHQLINGFHSRQLPAEIADGELFTGIIRVGAGDEVGGKGRVKRKAAAGEV